MKTQTRCQWVGWLLIAVLTVVPVAAGASQDHEQGDPRNDLAPEQFAHYAKKRLRDLRTEVGAIGKVMTTFDHRCHSPHERKKAVAADCQVAADARTHLGKVIEEEHYLVERLVRDGHGGEQWMVVEVNDFWGQVHDVGK